MCIRDRYLWRVVYTTAIDIINERTKNIPLDTLDENCNLNSAINLNDFPNIDSINRNELKITLEKALNSLLQDRRIVVKLHLAGMSIEEMADFLNWSNNRVRHLLYRGLKDLRVKLNEHGVNKNDK